ncbi:MAG: flagellar protein FlaG [Candidatus Margulisbacteria bacterium]|nr:flagellar protein FlaG [Candidatus Margulisiibacteriota bacterium]
MTINSIDTNFTANNLPANVKIPDSAPVIKVKAAEQSPVFDPQEALKQIEAGKPSQDNLKKIIESSNEYLTSLNCSISFVFDKDTNTLIVEVIDKNSGNVIKQIPAKEMVDLSARIKQAIDGILFDRQS